MENKNTYTLNTIVNEFARHGVNILQLMESLDSIVNTSQDFITVKVKKADGTEVSKKLPSIGKMQQDISQIQNLVSDLYDIQNNEVFVVRNGIKYPVIIPSYPYDMLPPLNFTTATYAYKNKRLYARINIVNLNKTVKYKKYRIHSDNTQFDEITVADENELLEFLTENSIEYTTYEDIIRLDSGKIPFSGSFSVVSNQNKKYILSTTSYTNKLGEVFRLETNDILYFDDTEVRIKSINYDTREVELETVKGFRSIGIGTDLKLMTPFEYPNYIDIPTSQEEQFFVFLKNIDDTFNVESIDLSLPIKIRTIDLLNPTTGSLKSFNEQIEKPLTLETGITPNTPILNATDFNVVRINDHLFQSSLVTSVQEKISRKNELNTEIDEIDKALSDIKSALTNTNTITQAQVQSLQTDLGTLSSKRRIRTNEYASIISELSAINTDRVKYIKPKFRIRGFFDIPQEVKSDVTGTQRIVQFLIAYRYKGINNETNQSKNFTRTDSNGNKKIGVFSDWVEVKSQQRVKRTVDGKLIWEEQRTEDGQQVNINQVDIPIQRGETVEIRIKSISEVGFPTEPMMSEWSNIISVPFPSEITDINELSESIESTIAESASIMVESVLAARDIDLHTQNSIKQIEKYFAHPANEISSGLYNDAGNILNVEQVLKTYENNINELRKLIQNDIPELKLALISPDGTEIPITKNTNNKIFVGYFVDDILNVPESEQNGYIVSKEFQLLLYNTSGVPVYLRSGIHGGIDQLITESYELDTYRKYDTAPLMIRSESFVSDEYEFVEQKRSQYIYSRGSNFGLNDNLFIDDPLAYTYYVGKADALKQYNYTESYVPQLNAPGFFVYPDFDSRDLVYTGAPDYGAVRELKSGRDNAIKIPIKAVYTLTTETGTLPDNLSNVEFRKKIGFDIFLYQQNTISFDLEFAVKYDKDTF